MNHPVDGSLFKRMVISAAAVVENHKQTINELNVFPVPDGDTGINMSMTMNTAVTELQKLSSANLAKTADVAASAMLRGARGNSGVILSLLFRGFAKTWKGKETATGKDFAEALANGVEAAYRAIMKPTEGTILTVSRVSSEYAAAALELSEDVESILSAALEGATKALKETVDQNPVLKKAGVVDAGGKGFVCILEGMLSSLRGVDITPESGDEGINESADFEIFDTEDITFAYDTVYIVRKEQEEVDLTGLRAYLESIGDSLVISEDDTVFKVHVHTNTPGDALNESQKYGILELAKIENMRTQHDELVESRKAEEPKVAAPEKKYGIVSVCAGEGLAAAFRDLGVDNIVQGGQTMNPSTEDILKAVNATPAEIVYVFPNNKNIIMAAEQAIPLSEKKVVVIPTKTVPQGITALFSFEPSMAEDELTESLMGAFDMVSTMQITYAARNSDFDGMQIEAGEYLGLYNGALQSNEKDISAVLQAMANQVRDDGNELVSIFYGEDIDEETAKSTALRIFEETCPDAEITLVYGGQPVYYYLISAE